MPAGNIGRAYGLQGRIDDQFDKYKYYQEQEKQKVAKKAAEQAKRDEDFSDIREDLVNTSKLHPHLNRMFQSEVEGYIDRVTTAYEEGDNIARVGAEVIKDFKEGKAEYERMNEELLSYLEADPDKSWVDENVRAAYDNPENWGNPNKMPTNDLFGAHQSVNPNTGRIELRFNADPRYDYDKWAKDIPDEAFSETIYGKATRLPEINQYRYPTADRIPTGQVEQYTGALRQRPDFNMDAARSYYLFKKSQDPNYEIGAETGSLRGDMEKAANWREEQLKNMLSQQRRGLGETIKGKKEEAGGQWGQSGAMYETKKVAFFDGPDKIMDVQPWGKDSNVGKNYQYLSTVAMQPKKGGVYANISTGPGTLYYDSDGDVLRETKDFKRIVKGIPFENVVMSANGTKQPFIHYISPLSPNPSRTELEELALKAQELAGKGDTFKGSTYSSFYVPATGSEKSKLAVVTEAKLADINKMFEQLEEAAVKRGKQSVTGPASDMDRGLNPKGSRQKTELRGTREQLEAAARAKNKSIEEYKKELEDQGYKVIIE